MHRSQQRRFLVRMWLGEMGSNGSIPFSQSCSYSCWSSESENSPLVSSVEVNIKTREQGRQVGTGKQHFLKNKIEQNKAKYSESFRDIVLVIEEIEWHPHRFYKPCHKDKVILIELIHSRNVGDKTLLRTQIQNQIFCDLSIHYANTYCTIHIYTAVIKCILLANNKCEINQLE